MTRLLLVLAILTKCIVCFPTTEDDLVVKTLDGPVRGREYVTGNNRYYYGFHSIPFAAPPVGDLRFEAPQKPQPWTEILDARQESKACISISYPNPLEGEDCLYINVYTPSLKPKEELPVMFFIYGGRYVRGNSLKYQYDPDFLIEQDVIVVTFNYRVGAFGLLSTEDLVIPGNAGLKDQLLALKWTNENIQFFGGDPKKITIFGQSAGATSVGLHLVSKKSAGLFRAGIIQSGAALESWAAVAGTRNYTFTLANTIAPGNYGNDSRIVTDFLKQQSVDDIARAASFLGENQAWPVIEVDHDGAFINESPYEVISNGHFNRVPIIAGVTAEESVAYLTSKEDVIERAKTYDANPRSLLPTDLILNASDVEAAIQTIKKAYLKEGETFTSNLASVFRYFSDTTFNTGVIKQAELESKYVPVYLYQFAYFDGDDPTIVDGLERAGHAAELPYLFIFKGAQPNSTLDLLTRKRMVTLWTNFAKHLNPTPERSELFENIIWPLTKPENLQYLNINGSLELRHGLKNETFHYWNETYLAYGVKPLTTF